MTVRKRRYIIGWMKTRKPLSCLESKLHKGQVWFSIAAVPVPVGKMRNHRQVNERRCVFCKPVTLSYDPTV